MSEQDGTLSPTKQRKSDKTITTYQENGKQALTVQRPTTNDVEDWKAYWKAQGQPWRTEPEIDEERQKHLAEHREIKPNIKLGVYPFKGIKLHRADIEWLLSTHDNNRGHVNWDDENEREREGIDFRGANLGQLDLSYLPLTRMRGGLDGEDWDKATKTQTMMAAVIMKNADLHEVHMEGAILRKARLEQTFLSKAHLENTDLFAAHLEGANLRQAHMDGASLERAYLDSETNFRDISLGNKHQGFTSLSDIRWGDTNLTLVKWSEMKMLGEEHKARNNKLNGQVKGKESQLDVFEKAVRANRQLAIALQAQGMNQVAARFAYQAEVLEKYFFWYKVIQRDTKFRDRLHALAALFFSWFLFLIAGYGYKPGQSFIAYAIVIGVFATIYHLLGTQLAWNEAIVISMTAFHGRGFFPDQFRPGDPQALVAAIEAFVGLLIEVTLIATLTRRLFGK
jgi:uncharacterized protein YjbI with pentapeptide repeats